MVKKLEVGLTAELRPCYGTCFGLHTVHPLSHTRRQVRAEQMEGDRRMDWKILLAYITGAVDQELLLRNEYLVTENRILRNQIKGRIREHGEPGD